jgi:hypothetical protein
MSLLPAGRHFPTETPGEVVSRLHPKGCCPPQERILSGGQDTKVKLDNLRFSPAALGYSSVGSPNFAILFILSSRLSI